MPKTKHTDDEQEVLPTEGESKVETEVSAPVEEAPVEPLSKLEEVRKAVPAGSTVEEVVLNEITRIQVTLPWGETYFHEDELPRKFQ